VRGGNKKEDPVLPELKLAMTAVEELDGYLSQFSEEWLNTAPPPPPAPAPAPAPTARSLAADLSATSDPVPSTTLAAAPAVAAAAAAAATTTTTDDAQKPRRKLVRGGNKKEDPVLPELMQAMNAIDELDRYLSGAEAVFDGDEDTVSSFGAHRQLLFHCTNR
jgi:myosin III